MSGDDVGLVGRERELAVLRDALVDAAEGRARGVLVAAEAGGGKSRLVRALLEDLQPGAVVLRAQCVDLGEPGLPYLALTDLVRALGAEDVAATDGLDEAGRLQLFDRVAGLLGEAGSPAVVVVEDLQWVDASSADFVRFLLSRMASERLAVVATVRTDGLASRPRVRALVGELGRLPAVQRVDLAPFTLAEVAEFMSRTRSTAAADDVLRRTGGNPFFVEAVAQGADGTLDDVLAGRVDALPDDARTVVRAAAVATGRVPDRLLRTVVGLPEDRLDAGVRAAVADGVLRSDGDGYAFAHDLVRSGVARDLLPGERERLHAAYGAALVSGVAGPAPAAEVAHHLTEAHDVAGSLVWSLEAAADATRVLAPAETLEHLDRVLTAWPRLDDAPTLAGEPEGRVTVRAARAAGLAGQPTRAVELARRAVRLCDVDGDQVGGIQARAELVRRLLAVDATVPAAVAAQEAIGLVTPGVDERTAALAQVVLARALLADRRPREARPQAQRALAAVRTAGDAGLELDVLTTTALLDELDGDLDHAASALGDAIRLAAAEGELAAELRAHYALASLRYYGGDLSGALPVLRRAADRAADTGLRWSDSGVELRLLQAVALYASGDLDGSLEAADASTARPPDVASARLAAVSCYPAVARGLPDLEQRFAVLADRWQLEPQVGLVAGGCEAEHRTWAGDTRAAVAVAERAQQHLDETAGEGMYGGLWLSALGLAALADEAASARQRRDDAGASAALRQGDVLLTRVDRLVGGGRGRPGDLGPEGRAWHARAVAEHARLQGDPAVESWRSALDAFGYGHAYEQARCHWRLAEALVASGDRASATTHAEAAAAAAAAMGAAPLGAAVAATAGRARLSGSGADAGVLTPREREVLALVAEGMTNREIGTRLFISEKTASVHLSNLMTKLNVSSRTEAVTVAQRRGLLDVL